MKPKKKQQRSIAAKTYRIIADSEGGLPLPTELVKSARINIGDKFAAWKVGDGFMVTFPKTQKRKLEIPKNAVWGKVEPATPNAA